MYLEKDQSSLLQLSHKMTTVGTRSNRRDRTFRVLWLILRVTFFSVVWFTFCLFFSILLCFLSLCLGFLEAHHLVCSEEAVIFDEL